MEEKQTRVCHSNSRIIDTKDAFHNPVLAVGRTYSLQIPLTEPLQGSGLSGHPWWEGWHQDAPETIGIGGRTIVFCDDAHIAKSFA
jgi:hypothetical protein